MARIDTPNWGTANPEYGVRLNIDPELAFLVPLANVNDEVPPQNLAINPDVGTEVNPLDPGRGRFIPTTSGDQFFAELALGLGVSPSNLPLVLPEHRQFQHTIRHHAAGWASCFDSQGAVPKCGSGGEAGVGVLKGWKSGSLCQSPSWVVRRTRSQIARAAKKVTTSTSRRFFFKESTFIFPQRGHADRLEWKRMEHCGQVTCIFLSFLPQCRGKPINRAAAPIS